MEPSYGAFWGLSNEFVLIPERLGRELAAEAARGPAAEGCVMISAEVAR